MILDNKKRPRRRQPPTAKALAKLWEGKTPPGPIQALADAPRIIDCGENEDNDGSLEGTLLLIKALQEENERLSSALEAHHGYSVSKPHTCWICPKQIPCKGDRCQWCHPELYGKGLLVPE